MLALYHDFYTWKIMNYLLPGLRYCCVEAKGLAVDILKCNILIESLKATHLEITVLELDLEFMILYDQLSSNFQIQVTTYEFNVLICQTSPETNFTCLSHLSASTTEA